MKLHKKRYVLKKNLLITMGVGLLSFVILFMLVKTKVITLHSKNSSTAIPETEAKTTSTAPSAQENFTGGDDRKGTSNNPNEGTVSDASGNSPSTPPQSQWVKSADGSITLYAPAKDATLTSGDSLSGASSLERVSFRLIDDVSGVIAQGSLSVVNGKFSGKFSFSTTGTSGRLDVFSASSDGVESSNIEIPIRYR